MEINRLMAGYKGSLAADALSMPVHWYYDRAALTREYGNVDHFMSPKNPHTGVTQGHSKYSPPNERADILRDQAKYWGKSGVHYHQFLKAGENTLNFKLARELFLFITKEGGYETDAWLEHYIHCMLTPCWHHDTYIEGSHREFFKNYALGKNPDECSAVDNNIGGLATVPALIAALATVYPGISSPRLEKLVREHVALTHNEAGIIEAGATLARMLYSIADGQSVRAAIRAEAGEWLSFQQADALVGDEDRRVVGGQFSAACPIKDSMPSSLYLAWKYHNDFSAAIVANAMVGGDNCHRGAVVGSLLGAFCGEVPQKFQVN